MSAFPVLGSGVMELKVSNGEREASEIARMKEPRVDLDHTAYCTIGAAIEVHRVLGPGLLESVYEEALCIELAARGIPFARQVRVGVAYKVHNVGEVGLDVLVCEKLILELKATDGIAPVHLAQLLSYLKATRLSLVVRLHAGQRAC
jgi:GxxExxY protein